MSNAGSFRLSLLVLLLWCGLGHSAASAQAVQVKPWFLLIADTSGSMNDSAAANSCGYSSNRMGAAKCAIRNLLDATGDAEFGLMQFNHRCINNCSDQGGGDQGDECDADRANLEAISPDNRVAREWVDGICQGANMCVDNNNSNGSFAGRPTELYAVGYTPLGDTLVAAREYFQGQLEGGYGHPAPSENDSYAGCRPIYVILLTDGSETCGGNAPVAAGALLNTTIPTPGGTAQVVINTYVIGFGISPGDTNIEAIAQGGATDAPGPHRGFYANDEETLAAAFNQIVVDAQVRELCNGGDDDCDGRIDEDNQRWCDVYGRRTTNPAQTNLSAYPCSNGSCTAVPGEQDNAQCAQREWAASQNCSPPNLLCEEPVEYCDGEDDDCDGAADEDAPPLLNTPDGCDGEDSDCDGTIDEDCGGCIPSPETCDDVDNDCNGVVDDLTRPCSINLGACTQGVETCTAGVWNDDCTGIEPSPEECDGIDNNCDGLVDTIFESCWSGDAGARGKGLCQDGVRSCISDVWGSCLGEVLPAPELCDGLDNDCDDDANDDGADEPLVGEACGPGLGVCMAGAYECNGGMVECVGGNSSMQMAEVCDGLDNDCDGKTDEDTVGEPLPDVGEDCFEDMYGAGLNVVGQCQLGTTVCTAGEIVCPDFVGPESELCDDFDHDCDGNPINGVDQTDTLVGRECGTNLGLCQQGLTICSGPPYEVVCDGNVDSVAEVCDGEDNDCDGRFDEGASTNADCFPYQNGTAGVGRCQSGTSRCNGGSDICVGAIGPVAEICDGEDNDCDGQTDEGNLPGAGAVCGNDLGVCDPGVIECQDGALVCNADPLPGDVMEACDGLDNDCDGNTDEGNPGGGGECVPNGVDLGNCEDNGEPCGECQRGTWVCTEGASVCQGAVGITPEVCDGRDNDCDGEIDDGDLPDVGVECFSCLDANGACNASDEWPPLAIGQDALDAVKGTCMAGVSACDSQMGTLVCNGATIPEVEACDGEDNDCDSRVDEGIPVGQACGDFMDVGECVPGRTVCMDGGQVCDGEIGPSEEVCDGLDNDCDGVIDDGLGLGDACGTDEGLCMVGQLECQGGDTICVGAVTPQAEICDGEDNDCDGNADEGPDEDLCPGSPGARCIMDQCALPCAEGTEFDLKCPTGKSGVDTDDGCYCVGSLCDIVACSMETLADTGGELLCAPENSNVGACLCKNNQCDHACAGVVCDGDLVCDPTDGRCKVRSCLLPQFACADDERCDPVLIDCVADECATANCDGPCRGGECFASCAGVSCADGQKCQSGQCVDDRCAMRVRNGDACGASEVCNPVDGSCITAPRCSTAGCPDGQVCDYGQGQCAPDPCLSTRCGAGEVCQSGECVERCPAADELDCGGVCVRPDSSRNYCGATGDCLGGNAGTACEAGFVCANGVCSDECPDGRVECDGTCVDPTSDGDYCGASGNCQNENAGTRCSSASTCVEGRCVSNFGDGTGGTEAGGDRVARSYERVSAAGGGGCACTVAPGHDPVSPRHGGPALSLALLSLLWVRLRRRGLVIRPSGRAFAGRFARLAALVGALLLGGCEVDTFCVDCPDPNAASGGRDGQGGTGALSGGGDGDSSGDGDGGDGDTPGDGDGGDGDAPGDGGVGDGDSPGDGDGPGCSDEVCNGLDDDCDGQTDEGVDPAAEGIDLDTDVQHCGACGQACQPGNAFGACVGGSCTVGSCDFGYVDADGDAQNGCEYRCVKDADDDLRCDRRDNDCDEVVDEDIDFDADANNCGDCNSRCSFPHAQTASCVAGACELSSDDCDADYYDLDGSAGNGCEYYCKPSDPDGTALDGVEVCNARDDDCDGAVDEEVGGTADPENQAAETVGADCWPGIPGVPQDPESGECTAGTYVCQGGVTVCDGGTGPADETCDGLDNDCDGTDDNNLLGQGGGCGIDRGQCEKGTLECQGGTSTCVGAVLPAEEICDGFDNDCDGAIDEHTMNAPLPDVGVACFPGMGGGLLLGQAASVEGECQSGLSVCLFGGVHCPTVLEATQNGWDRGYLPASPEQCDALDHDCDGDPVNGVDLTDLDIGRPCGEDVGECTSGLWACNGTSQECANAGLPQEEICNGLDDDCDGSSDEAQSGGQPPTGAGEPCLVDAFGNVQYGDNLMVMGQCQLGTTTCSNGIVACPDSVGAGQEACGGGDEDCDGLTDETDPLIGQRCDDPMGQYCNPGTYVCSGGSLSCTGVVAKAPELCDGVDNDCDPNTPDGADEPWIQSSTACRTVSGSILEGGAIPSPAQGQCVDGTLACVGGSKVCDGETRAVGETCDNLDNDCDGSADEDYQKDVNIFHCGTCGNRCDQVITDDNVVVQCSGGNCGVAACQPGYYPQYPAANYCSVGPCQYNGAEVCNGLDDDCSGVADDGVEMNAPSCPDQGACAGNPSTATCDGINGWTCGVDVGTETCNDFQLGGDPALDEDCDGKIDEGFGVGTVCFSAGVGACATAGKRVCNPDYVPGMNSATVCASIDNNGDPQFDMNGDPILVSMGAAAQETCDNTDQDCDGSVDEACPIGMSGMGCVSDDWVDLGNFEIYQYEASRPDSTQVGSGTVDTRACSAGGRLPWTDVTYDQAVAACEAAGATLCSESRWVTACQADEGGTCNYPYPDSPDCDVYVSDQCNGFEYDADPTIQPSGQSGVAGQCFRERDSGDIYEMSGNVKELVLKRNSGVIPVKGGAHNNLQNGMRCDFDFPSWPDGESYTNVGFRCCRSGPPVCETISASSLGIQVGGFSTEVTHQLNFAGTGEIVSVDVVDLQGNMATYGDISGMFLRSPAGTEIRLADGGRCGGADNFNVKFSDSASTAYSAVSCTSPVGGGASYRPVQALNAFDGQDPQGNWRIRVNRTGWFLVDVHTLQSWGIEVCYSQ